MYFEKRESKKSKKGYTWTVLFYYTDLNGFKKRYKKSGFETKQEAKAHGLQMLEEINQSGKKPENKTLLDVWKEWEALNVGHLAPGSINRYRNIIDHDIPFLNLPIRSISFWTLQQYFKDRENYCLSTNQVIRALLSNLFKYSKKAGYIVQNPMSEVELYGKEKKTEPEPLTFEDVQNICYELDLMNLSKKNREQFQAVIWIGYYTGLRLGEIMALEKSDIDLKNKTLSVNKRVEYHDGKQYITDRLKTKASRAVVPICKPCADFLAGYLPTLEDDALFTVKFHTVETRLKQAAKNAGIEGFHAHRLRHTFVSNVVMSGADPKTAAQLARHSSVLTTLDIYTQIPEEKTREAVDNAYKSPEKAPNAVILSD